MKLNDDELWEVIYNMDGHGLADFLNQFCKTSDFHGTQHGEKAYLNTEKFRWDWGEWSKWRENTSYHFNLFIEVTEDELGEERATDIFVCLIIVAVGLEEALKRMGYTLTRPDGYEKFQLM